MILVVLMFHLQIWAQSVDHYFDSLRGVYHGKVLFEKFQQYKKSPGLIAGLQNEIALFPNDTVQQIAGIAIFRNLYGYKWVEDKKLEKWINAIAKKALHPDIRTLAEETRTYLVDGIVGQQLTPITLPNYQGEAISANKFTAKYLIIDLWATWCGPCVQEMKRIPGLKKKYDNLEFYSISFDNEFRQMQKFVSKKGYDWPIVYAGKDHPLWEYFRVSALPNYFLVSPEGKILANTIHELDAMIAKYVKSK